MKKRGAISYIYAGLFLTSVLIILIGNSYFLIDRTRSNLIEIYWKQGELIVKSIAVSAQQSIDSVKLTSQQIHRNIKKTALTIDQIDADPHGITKDELSEILTNSKFDSIEILDKKGNVMISAFAKPSASIASESTSNTTSPMEDQTIDIERFHREGSIRFSFGANKLIDIKIHVGLHLLIASLENQNVVEFISFINDRFRIIADSDPSHVGFTEEKLEYLDALKSGVSFFFRDQDADTMEIIHPINYTPTTKGVLRISYPLARIDRIYDNTFKNAVVNSSVIMILAIFAAVIAVKLNQKNMEKLEVMEKKMRENEKLASLANLTAGIAHEVRNPLNSISITIQRLQLEFTPKNDDDLDEYVSLTDLMKKEVDRINLIVTDFLDFAKPFEPRKTYFFQNDFLEENTVLFDAEAKKKGVSLIKHFSADKLQFYGDREKLTQVLINLLRNALDATKDGGFITIHSSIIKGNKWLIKIEDTGQGIPKENINHIFDIYFTTKKTGTGLGLYISRKIVQAHDGNIELSVNPNKGTTVSVTLPQLKY